ncbi:MAG: hypothetical protein JNK76_14630 [Planctomycetales bacterium]|nr:hypothetical protein [Planctomycetales bacterium]MBN8625678.1 hypothetical protein [Planctomycetota bacterium]
MTRVKTIPITKRALLQRINRALNKEDRQLKKAVGARLQQNVGEYYVVDLRLNAVAMLDVDPVELARKLDVLQPWERVAS